MQLLARLSSLSLNLLDGCRSTCHNLVGRCQRSRLLSHQSLSLTIVHRGSLHLLGVDLDLCLRRRNYHKVGHTRLLRDLSNGILLAPRLLVLVVSVCITIEITQNDSLLSHLGDGCSRELSPRQQLLGTLRIASNLASQCRSLSRSRCIGSKCLLARSVGLTGLEVLLREFGSQSLDSLGLSLSVGNQSQVGLRRLPTRYRYIDQTQLLQALQETLVFATIQDEVVSYHLDYHTFSPSSAC